MTPGQQQILRAACREWGLPEPEFELRFDATRRFRFDAAWPAHRVALEVNGGVWVRGRHTRGGGYSRDMTKLNLAQAQGWQVYQVTPRELQKGQALQWIAPAIQRRSETPRAAKLSPTEKGILAALSSPRTWDELRARVGLRDAHLLSVVRALVMQGRVTQEGERWRRLDSAC